MDLNDLKNLNMDDIKAKVLAFADKKTLIKFNRYSSGLPFSNKWISSNSWKCNM